MRVLFICTGNICRSPSAEAVFRAAVENAGLASYISYDSAGTHGYHIGETPDPRATATAVARGISMDELVARKVTKEDFYQFDLILAMDRGHLRELLKLRPGDAEAEVALFLPYCGVMHAEDVPDPYYGGQDGFDYTLDLIEEGVQGLLTKLQRKMEKRAA